MASFHTAGTTEDILQGLASGNIYQAPMTIAAWVYRTGSSGTVISIGRPNTGTNRHYIGIQPSGSRLGYANEIDFGGTNVGAATTSSGSTLNAWEGLVGTFTASDAARSVYLGSSSNSGSNGTNGGSFAGSEINVGGRRTGSGSSFKVFSEGAGCRVAEVAVWSKVLTSPTEIDRYMNGAPAPKVASDGLANLQRWYRLIGTDYRCMITGEVMTVLVGSPSVADHTPIHVEYPEDVGEPPIHTPVENVDGCYGNSGRRERRIIVS